MVDLWMHQDKLMWSRTGFLTAIQTAALAGSYLNLSQQPPAGIHLPNAFVSTIVMVGAALLTCCIYRLVSYDEKDRDTNRKGMKELEDKYFGKVYPTAADRKIRGTSLLKAILLAFVVINIFLAGIYIGLGLSSSS
jgi:hypothetical protein